MTNMELKLYFIGHEDQDGENLDLFVSADSPEEAITHWQTYYARPAITPVKLWAIPEARPRGALKWDDLPKVGVPPTAKFIVRLRQRRTEYMDLVVEGLSATNALTRVNLMIEEGDDAVFDGDWYDGSVDADGIEAISVEPMK